MNLLAVTNVLPVTSALTAIKSALLTAAISILPSAFGLMAIMWGGKWLVGVFMEFAFMKRLNNAHVSEKIREAREAYADRHPDWDEDQVSRRFRQTSKFKRLVDRYK